MRNHIFSISKCTLSTTRIQIQNTQMNHKTKLDVNPHLLFLDVHVFMCHFLNFNIVGHQSNSTNRFSPRHLSQPHSDLLLRSSKCNHRQEPLLPMVLLHLFFLVSFLYTWFCIGSFLASFKFATIKVLFISCFTHGLWALCIILSSKQR